MPSINWDLIASTKLAHVRYFVSESFDSFREKVMARLKVISRIVTCFLIETFTPAAAARNLNAIAHYIKGLPTETTQKVYSYTKKVWALNQASSKLSFIDYFKNLREVAVLNPDMAENFKNHALDLLSAECLKQDVTHEAANVKSGDFYSITKQTLADDASKDKTFEKALANFYIYFKDADLTIENLEKFEEIAKGNKELETSYEALKNKLHEKAFKQFMCDADRNTFRFVLGDEVIDSYYKLSAKNQVNSTLEYTEMVLSKATTYYVRNGMPESKAKNLAHLLLMSTSQTGLADHFKKIISNLQEETGSYYNTVQIKHNFENYNRLICLKPEGFHIQSEQSYEIKPIENPYVRAAFKFDLQIDSDGKTLRSTYAQKGLDDKVIQTKFLHTMTDEPADYFKSILKAYSLDKLRPAFYEQFLAEHNIKDFLRKITPTFKHHTNSNLCVFSSHSYTEEELEDLFITEEEIARLKLDPTYPGRYLVNILDIQTFDAKDRIEEELLNKTLTLFIKDANREKCQILLGDEIIFNEQRMLSREEALDLFNRVKAYFVEKGLSEVDALNKTHAAFLSLTQNNVTLATANYQTQIDDINRTFRLNLEDEKCLGSFAITSGDGDCVEPRKLTIMEGLDGEILFEASGVASRGFKFSSLTEHGMALANIKKDINLSYKIKFSGHEALSSYSEYQAPATPPNTPN